MSEFIQKNWFQIIISFSVIYSLIKSFKTAIKQKALEGNHLTTIENEIKELKKRIEKIEQDIFNFNQRLSRLEGKLNGK